MTTIGNVSADSTAAVKDVRDDFVAVIAEANNNDLEQTYAWSDQSENGLSDDAHNAINKTIEDKMGDDYSDATVQEKGNTLWDANAKSLKKLLSDEGVDYDTLSDEAKAVLDTAANIKGPTGALNVYNEDGFDGLVDVVANWGDGRLVDDLDAMDDTTDGLAAAFTTDGGGGGGGGTDRSSLAKQYSGNIDDLSSKLTKQQAILDATVAGISGQDAGAVARDVSVDDLNTRINALNNAEADIDALKTEILELKEQIGSLSDDEDGDTTKADLVTKYTDLTKVYGAAVKAHQSAEKDLDAVVDILAGPDNKEGVRDRSQALKAEARDLTSEDDASFLSSLPNTVSDLAQAGKKEKKKDPENEYYSAYRVPEAFIRENYADEIREAYGLDADEAIKDKHVHGYMNGDKRNPLNTKDNVSAHFVDVARDYTEALQAKLDDALKADGFTDLELSADRTDVYDAYQNALRAMYANAVKNGMDNIDMDAAVADFKSALDDKGVEYIDVAPFEAPLA